MLPSFAKPGIRWICVFLLFATHSLHAAVREIATISTSLGVMEFELFSDVSPRAVANFKYLADTKFYDSTAFHRHIAGFMVQGGDPLTRGTTTERYNDSTASFGTGGPEYTIPNEPTSRPDRAHVRGVISMAKTGAPDSGGSQFFILFGDAPHLDEVHAPMGAMISGENVLQQIEARPKNAKDLPLDPIVIHSVRVRSEFTAGTVASRMRFQPGTIGGLLRKTDRNQDVCGSYQLQVSSSGAFSAQIQYYGRRKVFAGAMIQDKPTAPEADYVGTLDRYVGSPPRLAGAPLRVRLHARQTAGSPVSFVLSVGGLKPDDSDLVDSTLAVASGEVASQLTLADRYTAAFDTPLVQTGTSATGAVLTGPRYQDLRGIGYLTANVRALTGLALVNGRLQDGASFTLARPVSNEGGRFLLPLFFHELQAVAESQRDVFPDISLADWSSTYFNFGVFRFRLVAALELPPKPSLPQPANVSGNYLICYRDAKTAGSVLSRIATYLPVGIAAWTPPVPGQRLSPFALGVKAQLSVETAQVGKFQVARTNAAGLFDAGSSVPQLRFNPVDGTFQGSYFDTSLAAKPRRTFQGVLLQKEGVNKGVGFTLTESASVPVVLAP